MACFIHYQQYNNVLKLVDLNETTFQTLLENKKIRITLGGENFHSEQCLNIPDIYKIGLKYHRECYQKFTYAKTLFKRKTHNEDEPCSSSHLRNRKSLKLQSWPKPNETPICIIVI